METREFRKQQTIDRYRRTATNYDSAVSYLTLIREQAIRSLSLKKGDVVLDVACGTGLSFETLENALRGEGRIIGVEGNAGMIELARKRIEEKGWKNVSLIHSSAEKAELPESVDAVLFHFTHDVLQSKEALKNVFRFVKPGARIVSAGMKWARPFFSPVNLYPYFKARPYITSFEGFTEPWKNLDSFLDVAKVENRKMGTVYLLTAKSLSAS